MDNANKYDLDWFKQRALKSIKKLEDGVWDFSDSLLLYTDSGSEMYESLQEINTPYYNLVTKPEHEYLKKISKEIVSELPNNFEYIDLGPGTEHKERFIFDEAKKQGKSFIYKPVDISDYFLNEADKFATSEGIKVEKIKATFEELKDILPKSGSARFVSLGLTFSNYQPQEALVLLKEIASSNGFIFINTQMRDRVDMESLLKVYQNDAQGLVDEKVGFLDIDPDNDITPRIADEGFRVWTTVINVNKTLTALGVKKGDKVLVFQSLRYTKDFLESELVNTNHVSYDTDSSFIGTLIRT